ncbi:hypothetical protein ACTMTI_43005 [Nonomuraea sp. H19]|uniref:hypothetical protein n=1 Tax=Nonomuraea sp. H19 TaxID=3452206 RepID=UPI003F89F2BB
MARSHTRTTSSGHGSVQGRSGPQIPEPDRTVAQRDRHRTVVEAIAYAFAERVADVDADTANREPFEQATRPLPTPAYRPPTSSPATSPPATPHAGSAVSHR